MNKDKNIVSLCFFFILCSGEGAPCTVRVERENFRKQLQMMGYTALHVAAIHSSLKVGVFVRVGVNPLCTC